jgi:hypothetical protein
MKVAYIATLLAVAVMYTAPGYAQEKTGAVLLLPESDMDRELADDLTEVLISAVIDKSGKTMRIVGKEVFRKVLHDKKPAKGKKCIDDNECIRKAGKGQKFSLLLVGKVGKAKNGYRLEVWKLSMVDFPDRTPFRKRVPGDLAKLIGEVEAVATWAIKPDNPFLTIKVSEKEANIYLDGKMIKYDGKRISVPPGKRVVEARKIGFEDASAQVDCKPVSFCEVSIKLKKKVVVKPPDDGGKKPGDTGSTLWPWIGALGGLAVVSAGGSIIFYSTMTTAEDDFNSLKDSGCPNGKCWETGTTRDEFDEIIDRGQEAQVWHQVFLGVSAAATVGAVTLLVLELTADKEPGKKTSWILPHVGPDYSGFAFEMTF